MFESKKTKTFGKIDCAYSLSSKSDKTVILFHGYGADCWDLYGLKSYLDPNSQYNWYFPNGTSAAEGLPMGRSWFPINVAALEKAMREGTFRDFSRERPVEIDALLKKIEVMFTEMNIDPQKTVLGGFSQGAMLALETVLDSKDKWRGLCLFSAALFNKDNLPLRAMKREGFSFFQSHGTNDVILPHHGAEALYMLLKKSTWLGEFHSFLGGHEIPLDIIEKAKDYLKQNFK